MRLAFWSRPAPDERQHAIAALRSLGATSVPGLAAALSWSVPRTQKVLQELYRRGPPGLLYDARTGTVRWHSAPPPVSRATPPATVASVGGGAPPPTRVPTRASPLIPPVLTYTSASLAPAYRPMVASSGTGAAPRSAAGVSASRECARCHTPLVPTADADVFACPMCGRRLTGGGALVSPSPSRSAAPTGPDPKIQQLIAAWATGQPAPCPQCRQPLRHTADGEFRCGSCGARISYGPPATTPPVVSGGPVVGPSH